MVVQHAGYQHGAQAFSAFADGAWAADPGFGSADAFFIEDNTIGSAADCERGSRLVVRNNTVSPGNGVNSHGTGLFGIGHAAVARWRSTATVSTMADKVARS